MLRQFYAVIQTEKGRTTTAINEFDSEERAKIYYESIYQKRLVSISEALASGKRTIHVAV